MKFACGNCRAVYEEDDSLAGQMCECARCGGTILIPRPVQAVKTEVKEDPVVEIESDGDVLIPSEEACKDVEAAPVKAVATKPEKNNLIRNCVIGAVSVLAIGGLTIALSDGGEQAVAKIPSITKEEKTVYRPMFPWQKTRSCKK